MVQINEAWHILSDPNRRAKWDRQHTVVEPAPWRAPDPAEAPPAAAHATPPPAPPRPMETPQRIAGIAIGVLALVAVVVAALTLSAGPPAEVNTFESERRQLHVSDRLDASRRARPARIPRSE